MSSKSRTTGTRRTGAAAVSVMMLSLAACGSSESEGAGAASVADMDPVTIRFSHINPQESPTSQAFLRFAEEVEEKSDGKITFESYWSSSLLSPPEVPDGLTGGVADLAMVFPSTYPEQYPVGTWLLNFGAEADLEFPGQVFQAFGGHVEATMNQPEVAADFEKRGVHWLFPLMPVASYGLMCREEATDLDDMQGLRVRTPGPLYNDEVEALGMTPTDVAYNELYQALQQGVIDCALVPPEGPQGDGTFEVAKHYTTVPFSGFPGQHVVMSQSVWDELPEDARQIITDAGAIWVTTQIKNIAESYAWAAEAVDTLGVQLHQPDQEVVEILESHQEERTGSIAAAAPEGVSDPEAFIADYQATMDDWGTFVTEELGSEPASESLTEAFASMKDIPLDGIQERLREVFRSAAG